MPKQHLVVQTIVDSLEPFILGDYPTQHAADIFREILPAVLDRFLAKNADYGNAAVHLGSKGQFTAINGKFWKIKAALWDDRELTGEPVAEVLEDMIGHCLLTLHFLSEEKRS